MIKLLTRLSCLGLMQMISVAAWSQDCGTATIDSAIYLYNIGRFDEAINDLNGCLNSKHAFSFDQRIQAHHLLALSYLAIDSAAKADESIEELLRLKSNFEPIFSDPDRFVKELAMIKARPNGITISSVSKKSEDVRLAPATAIVITQEEMLQRGYKDIVDVLKDIPGFDISVYYGQTYANIYQRGLRTQFSDRTLILVDGVEDNDLWSYFADISQQYPITNVKRIEVIYGPSSTMYGPNAFSGVINIITKEADEFLNHNHSLGVHATAGLASFDTKYFDGTVAWKKGIFSMTLTGRVYYSDRPDLSSQAWWDFDPSIYDSVGYASLLAVRGDGKEYLTDNDLPDSTKWYVLSGDNVKLTDSGEELARKLDKAAYDQSLHGQSVSTFENKAKASYINAKMNIGDLALGFVSWEKEEGAGTTYTDRVASVIGTKWYPSHKYLYLSYNKPINQKLLFSTFINYRIHTIQNGSSVSHLYNYANGDLELKDLAAETPAYFATKYYYEQSKQFRSEFKILYTQSENFYLIGGVELRNSELQGYYLTSSTSRPQENGIYSDSLPGGNAFDVNDIGVYAQGQYRSKNKFGFTVGGRLDYNQIRQDEGLGYTFSPRVVVDKIYKDWVYKIIFSTGVENVSNFTKYNGVGTLVGNPDLKPESIYNYEISVSNKISGALLADVDVYYSNVRNTVRAVSLDPTVRNGPRHNINVGDFNIWGIQSNLYYTSEKFQLSVNYSYCYGVETKDSFTLAHGYNSLKVADIATNKINAIVNYVFMKHYNFNFRGNYVSGKQAGEGTTVPQNDISLFPGYFLAGIAITARDLFRVNGMTIQFCCNNILDKNYYGPGIGASAGKNVPGSILQMGRNFSFSVGYEF